MSEKILKATNNIFIKYCREHHLEYEQKEETDCIRLDISSLTEKSIVKLYNSGKILIQGKENKLKEELKNLKQNIEIDPKKYLDIDLIPKIPTHVKYTITTNRLQDSIKNSLSNLEGTLRIIQNPNDSIIYRALIGRETSKVILTQYTNGTLFIQGKTELLFDEVCDNIEKIANPSETEVIVRYISNNETALKEFSEKDTPILQENAKNEVNQKLGDVFNYLDEYNKKQFIAAQCLCNYKLDLPEYSAVVMPVSKGFEGFIKKLLIDIQLVPSNYFNKRGATFTPLTDRNNQKRINLCKRDKQMDPFLKKINVDLDHFRNFMMHSDPSVLTIINNINDAIIKVDDIFKETKYIFDYFNSLFNWV